MLRVATVMRTSSGYHSHRSGEQVNHNFPFFFIHLLDQFVYCFSDMTWIC